MQAGIHEVFVEKLAQAVEGLKVGDGFEAGVTQGPLINRPAADKVRTILSQTMPYITYLKRITLKLSLNLQNISRRVFQKLILFQRYYQNS